MDLKKQISQYEHELEAKRDLASHESLELREQFQDILTSPYTLGLFFLAGFLLVRSKQKRKLKPAKTKHHTGEVTSKERLVGGLPLLLSNFIRLLRYL